jgi:acyl-coenzyme A thioesterase PaaI-like protein
MTDTSPLLDGWTKWGFEEPFEDHAGPFHMKIDENGGPHLSAFLCEKRHLNGGGFLHGGMLMAFADYALFVIAYDELREHDYSVTVSCQTEFLKSAAPLGALVFAKGHVTRNTGSLVFVRGEIYVGEDTLATFNAILKKIGKRA